MVRRRTEACIAWEVLIEKWAMGNGQWATGIGVHQGHMVLGNLTWAIYLAGTIDAGLPSGVGQGQQLTADVDIQIC